MNADARRFLRTIRRARRAFLAIVLALTMQNAPAQAPAEMEMTLKNMLAAVQSGSLTDFVAPGDASFKSGMTRQMLNGVAAELGPRLNAGYTSTFLGTLNQQGYTVYLWKLEFKDGKDDRVVTMAVRDGKVGGFFLR